MLAEAMIGALATALDFACRREHLSLTSRLQFSAGRLGGLQFWREFRPRQEQGSVGKRLEISDAILTTKATPPVTRSAQMILMIAMSADGTAATELPATASDEAVITAAGAASVFGRSVSVKRKPLTAPVGQGPGSRYRPGRSGLLASTSS